MRLFLDITRIAYRLTGTTPTGIDRVEFAYARAVLDDPRYRNTICVFTAPFFTGAIRRDMMRGVLDRIARAWRLDMPAAEDPVFAELAGYLDRRPGDGSDLRRRFRDPHRVAHLRKHMIYPVRDLFRSPARLKRWLERDRGPVGTYLNTSHNQLETPRRLAWAKRAEIKSVFFLHDTIPIDYPEFVASQGRARHARRLETAASMAALTIVNSATTERHIERHLTAQKLRVPPSVVIPLGVADAFLACAREREGRPVDAIETAGHPYFVTLSTIEPRKNLLFLFMVWRRLVERMGPATPRLVVTGQRGWENENIADVLERSKDLGPYLVEVSDLCDDALARLLAGARGLLQPSSIEGFGLPLIEGLTLGLPVVASDIAAHREVGAGFVELVDPIDGPGWLAAIEALANPRSDFSRSQRQRATRYVPLTWQGHAERALGEIGKIQPPPS